MLQAEAMFVAVLLPVVRTTILLIVVVEVAVLLLEAAIQVVAVHPVLPWEVALRVAAVVVVVAVAAEDNTTNEIKQGIG